MREQVGVDETLLREIVRRVLSVTRPERIVLFGSAASRPMTKDSDIDLLVVGLLPPTRLRNEVSLLLG
jgi:predicted nucleotidyltransferase